MNAKKFALLNQLFGIGMFITGHLATLILSLETNRWAILLMVFLLFGQILGFIYLSIKIFGFSFPKASITVVATIVGFILYFIAMDEMKLNF